MIKKIKSMKREIDVKCNICGGDDFDIFIESGKASNSDERRFATTSSYVGNERIVKCRNCSLVYVNPRLRREEIVDGYAKADESTYVKESKARTQTFIKCMNEIEKYAKKPGKILDVGCAAGLFLDVAKKRGWKVAGVEPNKWLADWGSSNLGIEISSKAFEDVGFEANSADVVTFWDVLEHVADPKKSLLESARILKKGGYLVVNYPDIESWPARLFGKKWWFILSVHLYYFSPSTIRRILGDSGFEVVKIQPHIQRLSFGYLLFRLGAYSQLIYKIASGVSRLLGLDSLEIPYYAGQTMVVAKKK